MNIEDEYDVGQSFKQLSKVSVSCCSEKFLQVIIKASPANFIFSKNPCFQHALLNTLRQIRLKYENY